jgi:regulator of protease activity HflC (stomatin/prohibitin superfamily)
MAEVSNFGFVRHIRAEGTSHVLHFKRGKLVQQGRGLVFWFAPMTASIAEVPVDDRELQLLFHGRSADFQDVLAQGVLTYRVSDPAALAERVDCTIDLSRGTYLKEPHERLALMLSELAQQHAWDYVGKTKVREILTDGQARIRDRVEAGLHADPAVKGMGLSIVSVRISSLKPTPELSKALEAPVRERIQQEADQAVFERRALAVEKERAIQENELQNKIELAKREEALIAQKGQNGRRKVTEDAEAARIGSEAKAERLRIESEAAARQTHVWSEAQAESERLVAGAKVESERARMEVYKSVPPAVLAGLAAQQLAGKLERIDHLNLSPELFGPLFTNLLEAGTKKLNGNKEE